MPVTELKTKFLKPAKYDDLITVKTTLKSLPTRHMVFYTELFNEEGELINTGETILVFVNKKAMEACDPPDELVDALNSYF